MIYLDSAATTKPCEQVIASAKKTLLAKLGEGDIIFTSGATESNNTALLGAAETYKRSGDRIVTTAIEHPSVANVMTKLEERGFHVERLAPKDHPDFVQALADAVDEHTVLVSCMAVNNETGFANDVKRLYRLVKRKNPKTIVHIDAVQGFLKVPLDGDLISISGHKIHASKGIGALYIRKGIRISPLLAGGGQQKNLRSGTEPVELRGKTSGVLAAFGIPDKLADSAIRVSMCADTTEADIDALIEGIRAGIARFRR